MEVKLNVRNIDLRDAQETVEDNVKQVQKTGRKVVLTYAGLLGMAYDEAKAILERGRKMVDEAEDRGEKMEATTLRQVKSARKSVSESVSKRVSRQVKGAEKEVQKVQKRFVKQVRRSEAQAENEIDAQIERVLERLGIPSRDRIVKLSAEIEALSRKIDEEVVQAEVPQIPAPLPAYDSMTAREIVALLDGMTKSQLADVKAYEMAHDNRVTVTREVDRRLEVADETAGETTEAIVVA